MKCHWIGGWGTHKKTAKRMTMMVLGFARCAGHGRAVQYPREFDDEADAVCSKELADDEIRIRVMAAGLGEEAFESL